MKKNQDYTDLVVRVMLDAEHEIKDGFVINKFDIFVADMNELLADIVQRCNAASSLQLEQLWTRVKNGERWTIGKTLIEAAKNYADFSTYLAEKARKDSVFKGTLLEFCARYQSLSALLEKHDRDRVFITIIETGVMGKVYSILAPVSEEIKRSKEISALKAKPSFTETNTLDKSLPEEPETFKALDRRVNESREEDSNALKVNLEAEKPTNSSQNSFGFISSLFRKKRINTSDDFDTEESDKQDPFTLALERSFGTEDTSTFLQEPTFDSSSNASKSNDLI